MRCLVSRAGDLPEANALFEALNRRWAETVADAAERYAIRHGRPRSPTGTELLRRAYALGGMIDQYLVTLFFGTDATLAACRRTARPSWTPSPPSGPEASPHDDPPRRRVPPAVELLALAAGPLGRAARPCRRIALLPRPLGRRGPARRPPRPPALPLSDKAQLRAAQAEAPPFGTYLAAPVTSVSRLHRTSGTTGQAMNIALSARDAAMTQEVGGRCHRAAGLGPGHRVIHCLNYQMWMGGLTDHLTLEATGALVIPFGVGNTELLIRTIREVGVTAISCTPSYPAVIARVLGESFPGVAPRDLGLKLGLFGGEAGLDDPALRDRIRDTWGMEPRNANYGVSDVFSNFAAQCEHDTRLHFMAADVLWPELIDPDTGASRDLAPGRRANSSSPTS
jgi:hypothetical protein